MPHARASIPGSPRAAHHTGAFDAALAGLVRDTALLADPLAIPCPALDHDRGAPRVFVHTTPGSKSLTNRAVLLASLCSGYCRIERPLHQAQDTRVMLDAVRLLGADVREEAGGSLGVFGVGGRWKPRAGEVRLDIQNAGTAARFLAAASVFSPCPVVIDGSERMRSRPIGELAQALSALGAQVDYLATPRCPPLRITPPAGLWPDRGTTLTLDQAPSSQFASALLMAGVFLPGGLTLHLTGRVVSPSYIKMTLALLAKLGASVQHSEDLRVVRVRGVGANAWGLPSFSYTVEPDASSATYFWAAAALLPGQTCKLEGLSLLSAQGDAKFAQALARMGALTTHARTHAEGGIAVSYAGELVPVHADMSDMPDAALTLAAVACFARGVSTISGIGTLRVKETDRVAALTTELAKIGVAVRCPAEGDPEAMSITPPEAGIDCSADAPRVEFDTYNDHRMAMCLALIGLRRPGVVVRNPGCVAKTYPAYWRDVAAMLSGRGAE